MKPLYKKITIISIFVLVCFAAVGGYFFFKDRNVEDAGSAVGTDNFKGYDKNGDGFLSEDEIGNKLLFKRLDGNNDGKVTLAEVQKVAGLMKNRAQASKTENGLVGETSPVGAKGADFTAAAEYSRKYKGISMLIMVDGKIVYEDYANKGGEKLPFELASGTKSFNGVMAAAAVQDGLLSLDEKVSDTITEWKTEGDKANITVRQLLSLTGGFEAERLGGKLPSYAEAIKVPLVSKPGEKFAYSGLPFQVFGELMKRKLSKLNESSLDYLKRRIFDSIGLKIGGWVKDKEGDPHLPSGARLTAREWAKFGELVRSGGTWEGKEIIKPEILDECFKGTKANPAYGLTWWMNREVSAALRKTIPQLTAGTEDLWKKPGIPDDLVFAAGAGKQRLYISRSKSMVIVRQASGINESLDGKVSGFRDLEFLKLVFGN